jgi:hypothetical protein
MNTPTLDEALAYAKELGTAQDCWADRCIVLLAAEVVRLRNPENHILPGDLITLRKQWQAMVADNARLREALDFYAMRGEEISRGARARRALSFYGQP